MSQNSPRVERIDALRAIALLPVFVINFASFGYGYETSSLGLTTPQGNWLAIAVAWLASFLLQAKGITLLTMLVGVSFVMSDRANHKRGISSAAFQSAQTLRIVKQALLGLVHGAFIYFGDILFSYAITSFVLLKLRHWKTRQLLRLAYLFVALSLLLNGLGLIPELQDLFTDSQAWQSNEVPMPLTEAATFSTLWETNLENWLINLSGQIFLVPFYFLPIMLFGVVAGRLRWLTHRRWQAQRKRIAHRFLYLAIVLNVVAACLYLYGIDQRIKLFENVALSVMWVAAPIAIVWFVNHYANLYSVHIIHHIEQLCSPLGRYSLSVYLFASLLMNLLFAGPMLALELGTVALFLLACAYWLACVFIARYAQARGWQGVPERWLSVRKHS